MAGITSLASWWLLLVFSGADLARFGQTLGIRDIQGGVKEGAVPGDGDRPQCYSSPQANPSEGVWKRAAGGVKESPMDMSRSWAFWAENLRNYKYISRCDEIWAQDHPGEGPRPYWIWEPAKCRLDEIDAAKFCRVMAGRKGLLLVGDSLTHEFLITLASILRAELVSTVRLYSPDKWLACDGTLKLHFYRNDYLDAREEEKKVVLCVPDMHDFCLTFANDTVLADFDTLVVNSGAHRPKGGLPGYAEMMAAASTSLEASMKRLHGEDAILVVRNTSPGHGNCSETMFAAPVSPGEAADRVMNSPERFGWATFHDRNTILEHAFLGDDRSWTMLDAYTPTFLRADSHRTPEDCLHYCLPGAIDHWATLLYNLLLAETTKRRA